MGSDSNMNVAFPAFSKDFSKKKRPNRLAKLKQCKLDARREQWLSQVKNKGCKEGATRGGGGTPPSSFPVTDERNRTLENLETRSIGEENEGSSLNDSDLEFLANSPTGSVVGRNESRKDLRPGSSSGSTTSRSSSSSSSGCCSGSVSEDEEDEKGDGCLDDWEALADALTADEKRLQTNSEPQLEAKTSVGSAIPPKLPSKGCGIGVLKTDFKGTVPRAAANGRAWRPDDAFRPQSLPNLSKQHSFPMNAERHCGHGPVTWAGHSIISLPSSCPICYEDLDLTDSSFLPCSCGFRLCLFCHKRILEADGRCPGCRKQYDPINGETSVNGGGLPPSLRLSRSCSVNTRS